MGKTGETDKKLIALDIKTAVEWFLRNCQGASVGQVATRLSTSAFVLPCGLPTNTLYANLTQRTLFAANEGIYTPPPRITQLRLQRIIGELLGVPTSWALFVKKVYMMSHSVRPLVRQPQL